MSDLEKSNVPTRMYGGQAIIEGVMIRGARSCAVSVRRADGSIHQENIPLLSWANGKLRRVPFVRGILVLIETLSDRDACLHDRCQSANQETPGTMRMPKSDHWAWD